MEKKKEKDEVLAPPPEPVHEMRLSRDEVYRIVNATYHASVDLKKSPMFAIGNRGNAYGMVAHRMDMAYANLVECGYDAVFDVKFYLREKKQE